MNAKIRCRDNTKEGGKLFMGIGLMAALLAFAPGAWAGTLTVNGSSGTVDVPAGGSANVSWDFSENAPATGVNLRLHNGAMSPCSASPPYADFSNPDSGYSAGTIGGRALTLTDSRYVAGTIYQIKVCAWQIGGSPENLGPESNTVQLRYGMGGGGGGIDLSELRKKLKYWQKIRVIKWPKPFPPCLTCPPFLEKINILDKSTEALVKEADALQAKVKGGKFGKGEQAGIGKRAGEIAKQLGENTAQRKALLDEYSAETKKAEQKMKLAPPVKQMAPPAAGK